MTEEMPRHGDTTPRGPGSAPHDEPAGPPAPPVEPGARPAVLEIVAEGARRALGDIRQLVPAVAEAAPGVVGAALAARLESRLHELVSLISNAVDYESLLRGRSRVEPSGFDLRAMLDAFSSRLRTPLGPGWTIEPAAAPDVPMALVGDPGRWRDALEILLLDLAGVAASGVLRIDVGRHEESPAGVVLRLVLSVRSPAAVGPRAVEAFLRRHGNSDEGPPRTVESMRADLVRRIVASNGGTMLPPVPVPGGLAIEILAPFGRRAIADDPAGPAPRTDLRGLRVLLAGAGGPPMPRHAALLRLWGCEVTIAAEGLAALHELRAAHEAGRGFAAALVADDVGGMDAAVFGRLVRLHDEFRTVRLARLVGVGVRGDSAAAREIGFDAYLPAALDGRDLREGLAELIRRDCVAERGRGILTRHDLAELRNERRRVLVVGFTPVDALVLRSLLERRGFASRAVGAGPEAVEAWEQERHDLVVVQAAGDEDSLATATALQVLVDELGVAPLLLVLGADTPEARHRAERAGVRHVVGRESDLHALAEQVERTLLGGARTVPGPAAPRPEGLQIVSGLDRPEDWPVLSLERLRESSLGMPALELELLDTFRDQVGPRLERMAVLAADGDLPGLARVVIDLKGLAMTVGAYALGRVCAALEALAHEGRRAELGPMLGRLEETARRTGEEVDRRRGHLIGGGEQAA